MSLLVLENLEKSFGQQVLLDHVSLTVYPGERIGLIGANGSGKSTLLRMIVGEQSPDGGAIRLAEGAKAGYLAQDPSFDPEITVIDEAEDAFAHLHEMSHRLRDLEHAMAEQQGEALQKTLDKYQQLQHEFDLAGGYVWHHKLEATLLGVGLPRETWEQKVGGLSGGQRSRLALAKLLISESNLLLLDEPTNHLDLEAVEWLENYLLDFSGAVLLISHDRYLLDRLATRIVWLRGAKLHSYPGNYSAFLQQRELQELSQQRAYEQQQADIAKQAEYVRRFKAGQRARQAKGREKRLERLLTSDQVIQQVQTQKTIKLALDTDQRAGDKVLEVTNLTKGFSTTPLWKDVGFLVKRGERIGIIGPNGSGKTTLLRVLLGEADADAGTVKWGANLRIGYYDQRLDDFDPENTVYEEVTGDDTSRRQEVRDVLGTLLFSGDDADKPMSALSGGERARVRLAQLLLDKPNVLLLDEPTNHLDIASCEALERALSGFPGTLLCVSHDRYFLQRIVGRLLVLRPPDVIDFEGSYTAWVARASQVAPKPEPKRSAPKPPPKPAASASPAPKKDNPYKRPFGRLTLGELEQQIAETERAIAACNASFEDPQVLRDAAKVKKIQQDIAAHTEKLQALEQEYFGREQ
jgi:ATP-binding cassette subfamily F protein 3